MHRVLNFTLVIVIAATTLLTALLAMAPDLSPKLAEADVRMVLAFTTGIMFLAVVVGGCLSNFRGLIKHSVDNDYQDRYTLSYYLRPLSGGICGVVAFFLLLGGAITLTYGTPDASMAWTSLKGRMPYVALALLAGYVSTEFMGKLKELAESLFALQKKNNKT